MIPKAPKVHYPPSSPSNPPPRPPISLPRMDSCGKAAVLLMAVQAISLLHHHPLHAAAADILSPLLSPVFNGLCNVVDCGKGICRVSMNHSFGFVCDCNPGWNRFHGDRHFSFLPCVVPNCSISSSCNKYSAAQAPSPFPAPPDNFSLFDPCTWSFCGGGDCFRTSTFEHRCGCKQGYANLLNVSSFPCYKDCSIGADCVSLGISISSSSPPPSSSTNLEDNGNLSEGDLPAQKNFVWLFMLMISLLMILVADMYD